MASTKPLVLLTGPNGFVGAHIFHKLLSSGYRVRGAVRSAGKASFLEAKHASQSAEFSFVVVPDIQADGALDSAMEGVDYVCHVASPYVLSVQDITKDLLEPAVHGTKSVLASALKRSSSSSTTIKRFIIVSSCAAVLARDKMPRAGYTYTEADWNPVTPEQALQDAAWGYGASKTFAERAAWDMWKEAKPAWDLVTLNPPMIYGPPLHEVDPAKGLAGLNTSLASLANGLAGKDPAFAPKVATPRLPAWVDVRNVADAAVAVLGCPEGTNERFLLCAGIDYFEDGLAGLRENGEKGLGEAGQKINRAEWFSIDSSKAKKMLGIEFIPIEKCLEDVWESLKEMKMIGN